MRVLSPRALGILIHLAQEAYRRGVCTPNPGVNALVFDPDKLCCRYPRVGNPGVDFNAIGVLVLHSKPPTVVRECWDLYTFTGRTNGDGISATWRFEDSEFFALPDDIDELVRG